ncbi:MAG TPA: hypothetical protein VIK03_05000 [Thermoleophilia bacterium]
MDKKTLRTLRKDVSIFTSFLLLGLVGLAALTAVGMDDVAGDLLPLDDLHALVGYTMAAVAGLHALLHLGAMRSYARRRIGQLTGEAPRA